jgi:prophage antirepressor-like protein
MSAAENNIDPSTAEQPLQIMVQEFEGHNVTLLHQNRVWLIAKEVGRILGYGDNGSDLVRIINRDWRPELEKGDDVRDVSGKKLKQIKVVGDAGDKSSPAAVYAKTSRLTLISEQGFYLVCMKTNKPLGFQFRYWLSHDVVPAIRRKTIQVALDEAKKLPPTPLEIELSQFRSENRRENRKLRLLERQQEEVERQSEHERKLDSYRTELALIQELEKDPHINPRSIVTAKIALNQKLTGDRLNILKPAGKWLSPTHLAFLWDTSLQVVGRCISDAGVRGDERYSRPVVRKATKVSKLVETYEYNEEGQELIREAFDEYVADKLEKKQAASS